MGFKVRYPVKKKWRLNYDVMFFDHQDYDRHSAFVQQILRNFAILYRLDYAISFKHVYRDEVTGITSEYPSDLYYFKANKNTFITQKEFRTVIDLTFNKPCNTQMGCTDFMFQMIDSLNKFPFPTEFNRPLNYPYMENHKNGKSNLMIIPEAIS